MQNVSTAWKQTLGCYDYADRPNILPISFVEVRYTVADPAAQRNAEATDNGHVYFSDTEQITNTLEKSYSKYPMFDEPNCWILDGACKMLSHDGHDTGFVSSVQSGADCVFSSHPVITVQLDQVYSTIIPGLTITWGAAYDEMARHFIVRVFNGVTLKNEYEITDNTETMTVIDEDITDYDKVVIEIIEWCLPYCRARVEEIVLGIVRIFDKTRLLSYTHKMEADALTLTLPDNSVMFEISNVDGEWNPDNPEGSTKYLLERQEISTRYGYKIGGAIEWVNGGTFYMSEWDTPSNGITAKFTARSLIDFMGATYEIPENPTMTLYELAEDALMQANLPTNPDGSNKWLVDESLQDIEITLPDDFDYTLAQVLQMCANAASCVMSIDRNGNIIVGANPVITDYVIDQFVSYANAEYKMTKPLKAVDVNDGLGAYASGPTGEVQKVKNPLIQDSEVADAVAEAIGAILEGRKMLTGEYRADPRLDPLDLITTQNKYAQNTVCVTGIEYRYTGAFRGKFEGWVVG